MGKIFLAVSALCVFCGILFAAGDGIQKLIDAKEYEKAVKLLDESIAKTPDDIVLRNMRGSIYVDRLKTPEKALDDFNFLINISEKKKDYANAALGYHNRGNAYYGMGKYEEAVEDHSRAIVLTDYFGYYFNRAAAYAKLGLIDDSIKDMTSAIELKPGYANSYIVRAIYYVKNKEFDLAAKDIEEAFKHMDDKQDKSQAYYNIVEACIFMGDFKSALKYLKEYRSYSKDAFVFTDDYILWNAALDKGIVKEEVAEAAVKNKEQENKSKQPARNETAEKIKAGDKNKNPENNNIYIAEIKKIIDSDSFTKKERK